MIDRWFVLIDKKSAISYDIYVSCRPHTGDVVLFLATYVHMYWILFTFLQIRGNSFGFINAP